MNTIYDTDHAFKRGYGPYCEVCELLDWMHDGPRMPKKCTHEGGTWPGLGYCADCKMTLPERDENMTYADTNILVERALAEGYGLRVELDAGVFDLFGADLREEWDVLMPGEAFDVLGTVTRSESLHERASRMYEAEETARTFARVFSREELEILATDYCLQMAPDYYAAPYDDEVFDALALKESN